MGKKYTELYNAIWQVLNERARFVVTSTKTHAEMVDYLADVMRRTCTESGFVSFPDLAEAVIEALMCQDDA